MKTSKKSPVLPLRVVAAVIEQGGKILIARRKEGGIGGDWEFPGGRVRENETPEQGLVRELKEELDIETSAGEFFCSVEYRSEPVSLDLRVYRVFRLSGAIALTDHEEIAWVLPRELDETVFSEPDRPVVRLLKELVEGTSQYNG